MARALSGARFFVGAPGHMIGSHDVAQGDDVFRRGGAAAADDAGAVVEPGTAS